MHTLITLAGTALVCATAAFAQDYRIGNLVVDHPRTFEKPAAVQVGGGYMTLRNTGGRADALIAVRSDSVPRIEMHKSETDDMGVARMIPQDRIEIPAGGEVSLAPGGLHLMFMGLGNTALGEGSGIDATLVFEDAGAVPVTFNVEVRSADDHGTMDHGTMDHGDHEMSD